MDLPYHRELDAATLRRLGIGAPWRFGLADRVRFGELDAIGHVNHTAYLRWFESFRLPFLKARHVTDYSAAGPRLVLRSVSAEYRAEMGHGLDYVVTGRVSRFRRTSFTMEFAVHLPREDGPAPITAIGTAGVVLLNQGADGRFAIPEAGKAAFLSEDGAVDDSSTNAAP